MSAVYLHSNSIFGELNLNFGAKNDFSAVCLFTCILDFNLSLAIKIPKLLFDLEHF